MGLGQAIQDFGRRFGTYRFYLATDQPISEPNQAVANVDCGRRAKSTMQGRLAISKLIIVLDLEDLSIPSIPGTAIQSHHE